MNAVRCLLVLASVVLSCASASAQLIHISYEGTFVRTPPPWRPPVPLSDPIPFRAQAWFETDAEPFTSEESGITVFNTGAYQAEPSDTRNVIRWEQSGTVEILSLTSLFLRRNGDFAVQYSSRIPGLTLALFLGPGHPLGELPLPPYSLPAEGPVGFVAGEFLLAGQFISGSITHATAEFIPIPEPATYALFAAFGLLILAIRRRPGMMA